VWLSQLIGLANFRFDFLLVVLLLGSVAVGRYSVAVTLSEIAFALPSAISLALFAHLTSGLPDASGRLASIACRYSIWMGAATAAGVALIARPLLWILGSGYADAFTPLLILLPGTVLFSAVHITTVYFDGLGRPLVNAELALAAGVLNLVLDLVLIPTYGVNGAAAGSAIAYAGSTILALWLFGKFSGTSWRQSLVITRADLRQAEAIVASIPRLLRRFGTSG
jgi:O-antigen/teichoic acid export membrane protein